MASLGAVGFASLLMGQSSSDEGDSSVRFWVPTGAEDSAWYGDRTPESGVEPWVTVAVTPPPVAKTDAKPSLPAPKTTPPAPPMSISPLEKVAGSPKALPQYLRC